MLLWLLGVNVERFRLVRVVVDLRNEGVRVLSVPVRYRDSLNIDRGEALVLAKEYAEAKGFKVAGNDLRVDNFTPLYWSFSISDPTGERAGGKVRVDRVDGHVWSMDEYDKYMYDYNCIFA